MQLTIVIAMFRMSREIPRTLFTFSPANQRGIDSSDYEIVVVDNGSPQPLTDAQVASFPANASYHYVETSSMSPAAAINAAIGATKTPFVGCVIDGARMVSPGVLARSLEALRDHPRRFVYCPSFHLGRQLQNDSAFNGYDQRVEDALLDSVDWRSNGYLLFEISNVVATPERLMLPTFESNCFFVTRALWDEIGGYDERFESAGGGLVNWEYFKRAVELDGVETVNLLGEASFHQFHGGASTNHLRKDHPVSGWFREYETVIGEPFRYPKYRPRVEGELSDFLTSVLYGSNSATAVAVANGLSGAGLQHEAVEILHNRSRSEPNNPTAMRDLAVALLGAGRYRGALATIDAAIAIAPSQAELFATRAQILRLEGRLDEARESIAASMRLDPLQYEAQFELGLLERVEENPDAAIVAFENAIEFNGELRGDFAMQLMAALSVIGRHDRAREVAYTWFEQSPRDLSARLDYVEALMAADRQAEAATEANAFLDILPSVVMDRPTHHRAVQVLAAFDEVVERLRTATIPSLESVAVSPGEVVHVAPPTTHTTGEPVGPDLSISEIYDTFVASVDRHFAGIGDENTRRDHALGGSIRENDARELHALVSELAPNRSIIIGAYLGLSTAIVADAAPVDSVVDAIDPSVRHRIFDDPISHAEKFLSPWSQSKSITLSRLFFGARSVEPAIYDLTHFPPNRTPHEALLLAEGPSMAYRPPQEADFVYVDVGLNDGNFVRIARRALGLVRPEAPVVFGSTNLAGVPDLLDLIAEADDARVARLRTNTNLIAGRHESILSGDGPLILWKSAA